MPKILGCFILSGILCGCVEPGGVDNNMLTRYRRAMASRNPQSRKDSGLNLLAPAPGKSVPKLTFTKDADGVSVVNLPIDEAIRRALANNLNIAIVSFDTAISRQQVIEAAAAFDYTLFGSYNYQIVHNKVDGVGRSPQSRIQTLNAGIRNHTVTGADWSLGWTMTRTWDDTEAFQKNTAYEPAMELQMTQPLLRGAWPEYNLANLRIARINRKTTDSQFRQTVQETVSGVIAAYWALKQTQISVNIAQGLLKKTKQTLEKVEKRAQLDATAVQIKQAEAAVASRKAELIRAEKNAADARDSLARIISDPQINLATNCQITPMSDLNVTEITIDAEDQLMTALTNSPLLEQARLAIATSEINVKVAQNETLPTLDLTAAAGMQGQSRRFETASGVMWSGRYASYAVGLAMDYPIGNRAALARLARARFGRLQAITTMQNTADQVAQTVNERIREIHTSYRELQAQSDAVKAAKEQLKALEATEEIRGRMTPEFLNLKLNAQQSVANSMMSELNAKVSYNNAIVDLSEATGTLLQTNRIKISLPPAIGESAWPAIQQSTTTPVKKSK